MTWRFDNSYARLPECFFSRLPPVPVKAPSLVVFNHALADELGLQDLSAEEAAAILSGNALPPGSEPIAQAYAGHQFGHFTLLGDGRAIVLGEQITAGGARVDLQLKGSGRTPYSRRGDGRAALGPMLREYLMSEALHALGVPTTRSLSVVGTGESVYRDPAQPGAVLARVAASHLRVGSFEYAAARTEATQLKALVDYALWRHPPASEAANPALTLLHAVIARQAELIAHWQRVGFIHGVMNTDNMTISGETIDYGPCAFMNRFDPATVFSSIDRQGRYAFGNQPPIAQWNLARLAEALLPLIDPDEDTALALATQAIDAFDSQFQRRWLDMMRAKLGLIGAQPDDQALADDLLDWMREHQADYTQTFSTLTQQGSHPDASLQAWLARWQARCQPTEWPATRARMQSHNPIFIPRNHLVETALAAAVDAGDMTSFNTLLAVLRQPYTPQPGRDAWQAPPSAQADAAHRTFCGT